MPLKPDHAQAGRHSGDFTDQEFSHARLVVSSRFLGARSSRRPGAVSRLFDPDLANIRLTLRPVAFCEFSRVLVRSRGKPTFPQVPTVLAREGCHVRA